MLQIRALTFDLDDTLWDNRPVMLAAEQALYDWWSDNYPRIGRPYTLEELTGLRRDLMGACYNAHVRGLHAGLIVFEPARP